MEHSKEKPPIYKSLLGIIWIAIGLGIIVALIFPPKYATKNVKSSDKALSKTNDTPKREVTPINKDSIERARWDELDASLGTFDANKYLGDELTPMNGVGQLQEFAELVGGALQSDNPEIVERGKKWEQKLKKIQVEAYPKLRRKWAKDIGEKLWVNDIDVKVLGKDASTIELVGGSFATNRNIAAMQNELSLALKDMRFKKAIYKWISSADEYDYYTIESKKDSEL